MPYAEIGSYNDSEKRVGSEAHRLFLVQRQPHVLLAVSVRLPAQPTLCVLHSRPALTSMTWGYQMGWGQLASRCGKSMKIKKINVIHVKYVRTASVFSIHVSLRGNGQDMGVEATVTEARSTSLRWTKILDSSSTIALPRRTAGDPDKNDIKQLPGGFRNLFFG